VKRKWKVPMEEYRGRGETWSCGRRASELKLRSDPVRFAGPARIFNKFKVGIQGCIGPQSMLLSWTEKVDYL
jgi:hypothetical protein